MRARRLAAGVTALVLAAWGAWVVMAPMPADVTIGSKPFAESVVLGEMLRLLAAGEGLHAEHEKGLGSTRIVFDALRSGEIDAYVGYTGTLLREVYAGERLDGVGALGARLAADGIVLGPRLGFDNTYAIGMRADVAAAQGIRTISDLQAHPDLAFGFSHEFIERADGWRGLVARYGLDPSRVAGIEHALAYEALRAGSIEATDLYSTDGKIEAFDLVVLEDDLGFFPAYDAVVLYRADLAARHPDVVRAFRRLEERIDETTMARLNARVEVGKRDEGRVAADFLEGTLHVKVDYEAEGAAARIARQTGEHLLLVVVSLGAAVLLGIGLGVVAERVPGVETPVLGLVGVAQTIPSLALLAFLIPFLGMGPVPAMVALLLYSLLPIVRNTHAGLRGIPRPIRESARVLGLEGRDVLWRVELPIAAGGVLAGIKTAAVINVGTATLGGLIGAGGYGESIFAGLRNFDTGLLLQGAISAMVLALLVDLGFGLLERRVVSRGLRAD